jgi:serine/threonine protein kinase
MAPEVLANQRYSNKADIYSFGMVMWECCARQVPFEGLNGVQAGEVTPWDFTWLAHWGRFLHDTVTPNPAAASTLML